ncbi:MAG: HIT domain-containing protein [Thermodesulfobacteriota bacterium]|nr:HIT domain-containing protein [Thermodesulfobacteriota bacterium]
MKNLWAPWRMTYIAGEDEQAENQSCIFCVDKDKAGPDKDRLILHVGRLSMVMMNRYPYNNGHLLVAPRRHVPDLASLTEEEMTDLPAMVRDTIEVMRRDSSPDGFNVGLNLGLVAGAGVADHMHFHIVPRWNGDTNFMTVLADVRVVPEHLEAAFDRLLPYFSSWEA